MGNFEQEIPIGNPEISNDQYIEECVKSGAEASAVVLFGLEAVQRVAEASGFEIASHAEGEMIHLASLGASHYRKDSDAA